MKRVVPLFLLFVLVACGSNQEETSVNDVINAGATSAPPARMRSRRGGGRRRRADAAAAGSPGVKK